MLKDKAFLNNKKTGKWKHSPVRPWVDEQPAWCPKGVDKALALLTPCMPPVNPLWRPCKAAVCCAPMIMFLQRQFNLYGNLFLS